MDDALFRLKVRRDELRLEVALAQARLTAFDDVIDIMEGRIDCLPALNGGDAPRKRLYPSGLVKSTVLRLIDAAKPRGLTVREIVHKAAAEGVVLKTGSVSSLTSRFMKDGVCTYKAGRYA